MFDLVKYVISPFDIQQNHRHRHPDIISNKSYTLPYAHRQNICRLALTSRGNILLSIDEGGRTVLVNFSRRLALYHFSFKGPVSAIAFSPSGHYFAVGIGTLIEVWHTPSIPDASAEQGLEFAPFIRDSVYAGHHDVVQNIEWSSDSRFFVSAAKDLTSRIWSLNPEEGFVPTTLAGHRECVLNAWFSSDQETIYTVSQDGALFQWNHVPAPSGNSDIADVDDAEDTARWKIVQRHYFMQSNAKVKCAAHHSDSNLLVAGFSNGLFSLYALPDFNMIHTLSVSQNDIDFVTINQSGEWLAFGASKLGQLLVWEWQSESYILKQQGHYDFMNALVYSPDGQRIITTADDGKVKLWDIQSGFCVVTFTEHKSGVTACEFAKRGNVLFTSSLDGSVRAWDLLRYRNFRTFTAPTRFSFSCVAVNPSGEVVCAGSLDSFNIHVWSVQTGQLLDQLSGHEGPVASLAFAPSDDMIVSGSWDHTIRIWSIFGRTQTSEPIQLQAAVLHVAFRPDSKQIAVSTLDGQLSFWSVSDTIQQAGVDGRRDVSGGRKISDRRTAANIAGTKSFNCIAYSVDGSCIIASGNSKYICLYDVQSGSLIKKFTVSVNLSMQGTQEYLNSRNLTEAGPRGLIDEQGEASDLEDREDRTLPGAHRGAASSRRTRPEIRSPAVAFSPTGRAFCAASTEGLLIYSLDHPLQFDPFDLDIDITPANTVDALNQKDLLRALVMAFRLNERPLIYRIYQAIPVVDLSLIMKRLPSVYLGQLLRFVAQTIDESPYLEFSLRWMQALLSVHGHYLKENASLYASELRIVQKAITKVHKELATLADENVYTLDYVLGQPNLESKMNGRVKDMSIHIDVQTPEIPQNGVDEGDMGEDGEWFGVED